MKKINNWIDKNMNKVLIIFLFMQPIIDVLTAVMIHCFKTEFTIGVVLRILFLVFVVYYLFFVYKNKERKKSIIYIITILIYILLFSVNILYSKGMNAFIFELKSTIKTFYFPILLVCIYEVFRIKKNIIKPRFLKNLFIFYGLLVFIPNILGLGYDSYAVTKSGSIGWFYSANEISSIFSILMPIFIYIVLVYISIKRKKYKKVGLLAVGVLLISSIGILVIPRTNFYKNIVVHLEFLGVKNVSDIVKSPKVLDHFIFSQRLSFWSKTNRIYKNSNLASKVVGIGYIDNYATDEVSMKMVEMDYVDIFYRHGIVGFIIYMSSFIYMVVKLIKKYFNNSKINNRNKIVQAYMLSLVLSVVLAFLTGHVITSPSVSIFVALIFNLFYNELYEGEV